MIDATLSITSNIVSTTLFVATITFDQAVTLFADADITLTAVDGGGITGVTVTVSQQTPSVYELRFALPSDAEGAFSVQATGTVLPDGETQEQAINLTPAAHIVTYDTSVAVMATWGSAIVYGYGDNDEPTVEIPLTFASAVVISSPSIFQISPVSPLTINDLEGLEAFINGTDTDWTLTIQLPLGLDGDLLIDPVGEVFKTSTMVYDLVTIAPLTLAVNTLIPSIEKRVSEPNPYMRGEKLDAVFQFNTPVQFENPPDFWDDPSATILDHFEFGGVTPGNPPTLYVYSGAGFPTLPLPDTANLGANWTQWTNSIAASAVYLMRYESISDTFEGNILLEVKKNTYFNPGV